MNKDAMYKEIHDKYEALTRALEGDDIDLMLSGHQADPIPREPWEADYILSEKAVGLFRQRGNVRAIFSEFCEIQRKLPCCRTARAASGTATRQEPPRCGGCSLA